MGPDSTLDVEVDDATFLARVALAFALGSGFGFGFAVFLGLDDVEATG